MQPVELRCPNCGAGLGAPQDGEYLCAYCGHRSIPPAPPVDQAHQDELVRRAVAAHDAARFEQQRRAAEEVAERGRAAGQQGLREGARAVVRVCLLFLVIAGASVAGAIYVVAAGVSPFLRENVGGVDAQSGPQIAGFLLLMAVVMGGVSAKMFADARRTFGPRLVGWRGDERLLAGGVPGRAVVTSYRERNPLEVSSKFDLVLRVELPGRPAYVVKRTERVAHPRLVTTGAELPVIVDPAHERRMMIDWETASAMQTRSS